jgi:hypothetical protein
MNFILTHWVNALTLHGFVKNLGAPCYIVVLAINGEQRLAGHAVISCKSMFKYGF